MYSTEEEEDTMNIDVVNDDEDVEFNKIFTSVKRRKSKSDKTDELYEQFVSFKCNGSNKTLTTPGEKGSYLIKIDITDTKDLRGR